MNPEIHRLLHEDRARQLQAEAASFTPGQATATLRSRLGWTLVACGLRLVQGAPQRSARIA
ncbi:MULTISPECIES: hypothetical protein [unclassified Streptomyces]|uniref:hypothetical protein n=1 Tax=unclassified Streptomyces TaxID=2593676 RepID=UPI003333FA00